MMLFGILLSMSVLGNEPDSAYLFAYATEENNHKNGLGTIPGSADASVLTGDPGDRFLRPEEFTISVGERLNHDLPPYSFTVVRIKTK